MMTNIIRDWSVKLLRIIHQLAAFKKDWTLVVARMHDNNRMNHLNWSCVEPSSGSNWILNGLQALVGRASRRGRPRITSCPGEALVVWLQFPTSGLKCMFAMVKSDDFALISLKIPDEYHERGCVPLHLPFSANR